MVANKKVAIIANRLAGGVNHGSNLQNQALSARANLWGRTLDFHFPSSITELREICTQITSETHEAIIVMGGDGTFNQVIRTFNHRPNTVPLYPFPAGTANDLAKELGLKADWNQVQTLLDEKKHDYIDLIEVNDVPFATVSGIGVGSTLTSEFNRNRQKSALFKKLAQMLSSEVYTALSAATILRRRDYVHHLHIRAQGFDEKVRTPAVFLCNQAFLGGNLQVAPSIDNTDRRFNVLIVTTCSRLLLLSSMMKLKSGTLPRNFFVFSTDHLSVTDLEGRSIRVFGDGETLTEGTSLEFKIRPSNLKVYRENGSSPMSRRELAS